MKTIRIYDKETAKWEYTLTSEETKKGVKYTLLYSESDHWTEPGKEVLSVTDNGNDFKFDRAIGKTLASHEMNELLITLQLIKTLDIVLAPEYEFINLQDIKSI